MINLLKHMKKHQNRIHKEQVRQTRRVTLGNNRVRGRIGEESARTEYTMKGYRVERAPHGQDYIIQKKDPWSGRTVGSKRRLEVKTGNSQLSALQKKTKRKGNYIVKRYG